MATNIKYEGDYRNKSRLLEYMQSVNSLRATQASIIAVDSLCAMAPHEQVAGLCLGLIAYCRAHGVDPRHALQITDNMLECGIRDNDNHIATLLYYFGQKVPRR